MQTSGFRSFLLERVRTGSAVASMEFWREKGEMRKRENCAGFHWYKSCNWAVESVYEVDFLEIIEDFLWSSLWFSETNEWKISPILSAEKIIGVPFHGRLLWDPSRVVLTGVFINVRRENIKMGVLRNHHTTDYTGSWAVTSWEILPVRVKAH